MSEKSYSTSITTQNDLKALLSVLREEDAASLIQLKDELADNWNKKQIFRTETEMRVSVLNDANHPTPASKYWQSVREMSAHFDELMNLSFNLRREQVKREKLELKMQKAVDKGDVLKQKELQIDLDSNAYNVTCMQQVAQDRIREIRTWSKIKAELNDGTFDDQNVNTHQAESFKSWFEMRVRSLSDSSSPSEVINAVGPHATLQRLDQNGKLLTFSEFREQVEQQKLAERNEK